MDFRTVAIAAVSFGSHVAAIWCRVHPGPEHQSLGEFEFVASEAGKPKNRYVLSSSRSTMLPPLNNDNYFEVELNDVITISSRKLPQGKPMDGYWVVTFHNGPKTLSYTISHFDTCDVDMTDEARAMLSNYNGIRLSNLF